MGSFWLKRFYTSNRCVTSKAALATLIWTFSVATIYLLAYQPSNYVEFITSPVLYAENALVLYAGNALVLYAGNALVLCFYPLAGFLADNKFSRFKVISKSLFLLLDCLVIGFIAVVILCYFLFFSEGISWFTSAGTITIAVACILIFFPATIGFVGFNANVIQFGMDQLQDSPADHQSLFIHWFMWVVHLASFVCRIPWKFLSLGSSLVSSYIQWVTATAVFALILMIIVVLLSMSILIANRKRHWFFIDSARINPYKLVYKVSRFAMKYKVPIQRSAFTYCEDELPEGLNLGKQRYGGPFSTEEVENVKAFYGILKVIFSLGPVFFMSFTANSVVRLHLNNSTAATDINNLLDDNLLLQLMTLLFLPLYICLLRPLSTHVLSMLKRTGIGIILLIFSIICRLGMETLMLEHNGNSLYYFFLFRIIEVFLYAVSCMLIYIAMFEFICAQSPNSMKGLLIGLFYATRGLFDFLGSIVALIFIHYDLPFYSGYILNCIVGAVTLFVYTRVAHKYQYRKRDDICEVYRFAEEYYSKPHQESVYDKI